MNILPRFLLPLLLLAPASAMDVLPLTASRLDDLVSVVLSPTASDNDKRAAIAQIRDLTDDDSTEVLLTLFGQTLSDSANSAVLEALVSRNSPPVKLFLARYADHPKIGGEVLRTLHPTVTPKDTPVFEEILKRVRQYDKIPLANLNSALDIFAAGRYKPALPLVRELAAKSSPAQITAVFKLADIGDSADLPFLWTCAKDSDAHPHLRIAAVNSISSLGNLDDAQKLLAYARSFDTPGIGENDKNLQQYLFQSQNRLRLRLTQPFDAQLEITSLKSTPAGLDLDLTPIENAPHFIAAISRDKTLLACALVSGPHLRLELPAGKYDITLTPILPPDAPVLRVIQNDLRNLVEPERILRLGRPTLAGNISVAASTAQSAAILNATPAQSLDTFVAATLKPNLPAGTTGPFVLEGTLAPWGAGKPPLPAKRTDIPIASLYPWGLALVDKTQSLQIITILRESFDCSTQKTAHVVGYLAPYREGSDKFVFYALEMWNPP